MAVLSYFIYRNINLNSIAIKLREIQYVDAVCYKSNKYSEEEFYLRNPTNTESLKNYEKMKILNYLINKNNNNGKSEIGYLFNIYDNEYMKVDIKEKSFYPSDRKSRTNKNKIVVSKSSNFTVDVKEVEEIKNFNNLEKSNSLSYRCSFKQRINLRRKSLRGDINLIKIGVLFKDFVENGEDVLE